MGDTPTATKVKKVAKPKKAASHPPYGSMIKEAITSLKERGGSSRQAILKYIVKTYKINAEDKVAIAQLRLALKRGVTKGDLKQSKGTGASGSFKLGASKAEKKPKVKKAAKKSSVKKPKSPKKKKVAKPKKAAEKKKPKKPKAAKPKKAKSPAKKPAAKKPAAKKAAKPKKAKTPKKAKK